MATLRAYGVSVREIGTPQAWGEACDLIDAAMTDTGTGLFAAVAGWERPMSHVDMLLVVAAYGKNAHKVMPFRRASDVSEADIAGAHEELLSEIKFS